MVETYCLRWDGDRSWIDTASVMCPYIVFAKLFRGSLVRHDEEIPSVSDSRCLTNALLLFEIKGEASECRCALMIIVLLDSSIIRSDSPLYISTFTRIPAGRC